VLDLLDELLRYRQTGRRIQPELKGRSPCPPSRADLLTYLHKTGLQHTSNNPASPGEGTAENRQEQAAILDFQSALGSVFAIKG
jgi:hypothetical protein